ncbi:hypothetical protein P154DRAFT_578101 [Amniculicola lignicola CBS 123094]|uniref:Uncharacterized protein n=1 Tax=Amniculicola lignicola CBS 123094 TaxID=1392246 RepID=A0A6A5WDR4_9PLEO|nr:hypothetical protein P154DRAFT_578101 [Amniculicola lignicola CBS 123094]
MSLTAPYTNAMRIGQGFNTYTQEIRLENAVHISGRTVSVEPKGALDQSQSTVTAPPSPPLTPDTNTNAGPVGEVPTVAINGVTVTNNAVAKTNGDNPSRPPTPGLGSAIDLVTATPPNDLPFDIPSGPVPKTSQSVTYSTRAIENVSDIMDALNISTSMSIKYGTIHGNGNASFVNETKVLDSELNYVVSVIVNNDGFAEPEEMVFQDIPDVPLDRFTEVYGDSFISGFAEGGIFNAVISIKLNDKSKHKAVKQAVDVQLAVGPPTLEVGASESSSSEHSEALRDTEISISVNWVGGGEIKKPGVPWTIKSVVGVANAFPSMVARSSARTQAILSRYSSLRSFQTWKWKRLIALKNEWEDNPKNQPGGDKNKDGKERYEEPVVVLNYVPCSLYTADLFDALMNYKKLWKRIGEMLQNPSKYKIRAGPHGKKPIEKQPTNTSARTLSPLATRYMKTGIGSPMSSAGGSPCDDKAIDLSGMERAFTFAVEEGSSGWNLYENNMTNVMIPPEPVALNEARLLCREAMTLITEEASRLVDHPHLAYAEFDKKTKSTRMKRPNYAFPEVLKERLPIPIHNDILSDLSTDGAYLKTVAYSSADDTWFEPDMVGDPKSRGADLTSKFGMSAQYEDFSTLELTEAHAAQGASPIRRLALHRYRLGGFSKLFSGGSSLKLAEGAIGAIGIARVHDDPATAEDDGCTLHLGHRHRSGKDEAQNFKALELANVDITKIDVAYMPGSGFIAAVTFYDQINGQETERLRWRQWEGREPQGLVHVINEPPDRGDGTLWKFVGLAGSWVNPFGHGGHVLARVTGVWKKVAEE